MPNACHLYLDLNCIVYKALSHHLLLMDETGIKLFDDFYNKYNESSYAISQLVHFAIFIRKLSIHVPY